MSAGENRRDFTSPPIPRAWTAILALLALVGLIAFILGISGAQSQRAWQAYLINFVYWTGLSFGAVLFVAVLNMANAQWGRPLKRMAEALGAFLPVSFLLFWILYLGKEEIFPWVRQPLPEKQFWLNSGFMFARNGVGLFLLTALSLALIYYSVKGDREMTGRLIGGREETPTEESQARDYWRAQRVLSPIIGIVYAFVLSLLAFDLIMSLDPHWTSTLFGAYYFMSCFYIALAALYFLSLISLKALGLRETIHPHHLHDLGKLVFAFCIFTGYLFYVQFLVIWYGNLPEETRYVILRVKLTPWEPVAWTVLAMIFAIPLVLLLSRKIKMKPLPMIILSGIILAGMWLERFILVAPSIWKGQGVPIGLLEVLITAGFFGIMGLSIIIFLKRVPLLPISDPLFQKSVEPHEEKGKP
jgi:Ni/Fe-hydrogenase subunit HybB-like protein